jgi:multiple sugar transport system permease protein
MQETIDSPPRGGANANLAAILTFFLIVVVIMFIIVLNAPTRGGPQVMSQVSTYLTEVWETALPYLAVVGIGVVALAALAALTVRREWPNAARRKVLIAGYGFIAPYLIVTLTFTVGVILFALYISFTHYDIFSRPSWQGLANYTRAFEGFTNPSRRDFIQSLYNVFWYSAIVVPTQTAAAIALAVLLNNKMRFQQFFRTVFYAPSVTSSVVITLIFMWIYLRTGVANFIFENVLGLFGLEWQSIDWLNDPRGLIQLIFQPFGAEIPSEQWYLRGPSITWMALMFQNIFTTAPTFMIMFLAALQDIDTSLYEASSIDGANGWQQFWRITLPLLRPIVLLVIVLGTIGTLQMFDQVYLATAGGPLGTTLTPVYQVFTEALGRNGPINMGYASALAFIVALIIFVFTFIQRRVIERGTEQY